MPHDALPRSVLLSAALLRHYSDPDAGIPEARLQQNKTGKAACEKGRSKRVHLPKRGSRQGAGCKGQDLVEDEVFEVDAKLLDLQVELLRGGLNVLGGEVGREAGVGRDADEVHRAVQRRQTRQVETALERRKGGRELLQVLRGVHHVLHRGASVNS